MAKKRNPLLMTLGVSLLITLGWFSFVKVRHSNLGMKRNQVRLDHALALVRGARDTLRLKGMEIVDTPAALTQLERAELELIRLGANPSVTAKD